MAFVLRRKKLFNLQDGKVCAKRHLELVVEVHCLAEAQRFVGVVEPVFLGFYWLVVYKHCKIEFLEVVEGEHSIGVAPRF